MRVHKLRFKITKKRLECNTPDNDGKIKSKTKTNESLQFSVHFMKV